MQMRRGRQLLPEEESIRILKEATNGVLCLEDGDRPYGVPMSFIYDDKESIYFHCALEGRKLQCIKNNPKACFTIIEKDEIIPEKFTTYFRSVIVEGEISIIAERSEMEESLRLLSSKYSPGIDCEPEISKGIDRVMILRLHIESITGKEAIERVRIRED